MTLNKIIFYLFLVLLLVSCKSNGCDGDDKEPTSILEIITQSGQNIYPLIQQISVENSMKEIEKNENGLYLMPLDLTRDKTKYFIRLNNGQVYFFTVSYTRKSVFVSNICGFRMHINQPKQVNSESSLGLLYQLSTRGMQIIIN